MPNTVLIDLATFEQKSADIVFYERVRKLLSLINGLTACQTLGTPTSLALLNDRAHVSAKL